MSALDEADRESEADVWKELWETDAARCCSCPSCNHYALDYDEHKDEPCLLQTIIERIIDARLALLARHAAARTEADAGCNAYYTDGPHPSDTCGLAADHWPTPHSWEAQYLVDRNGDRWERSGDKWRVPGDALSARSLANLTAQHGPLTAESPAALGGGTGEEAVQHYPFFTVTEGQIGCACGWEVHRMRLDQAIQDYARHVVAAVVAALGGGTGMGGDTDG